MKIYSTGWRFKSLKGHAEGKDKNIKFWLGKKYGMLQLNMKAWGPNNTWCNRNKPCAKANNVFAKVMWGNRNVRSTTTSPLIRTAGAVALAGAALLPGLIAALPSRSTARSTR